MWAVFGDVRRNELIFIVVDIAAGGHGRIFTEGRARESRILERLGCRILLWHALLLGFRGCASIAATGAGNDRAQLGACYSSVLMMVNNCGDKRRPDNIPGVWAARYVCTMMILYALYRMSTAASMFLYRISVLRHYRGTGNGITVVLTTLFLDILC